jgi:hypothetical protein
VDEFAHSILHDSFDPIIEKIDRRIRFELRQSTSNAAIKTS